MYQTNKCSELNHIVLNLCFCVQIVPEKCRYEVLSTKVEIRLAKAEIITWASLEHAKVPAVLPKPNVLSGSLSLCLLLVSLGFI